MNELCDLGYPGILSVHDSLFFIKSIKTDTSLLLFSEAFASIQVVQHPEPQGCPVCNVERDSTK